MSRARNGSLGIVGFDRAMAARTPSPARSSPIAGSFSTASVGASAGMTSPTVGMTSPTAGYTSSPVFRRHSRKASTQIIVPPIKKEDSPTRDEQNATASSVTSAAGFLIVGQVVSKILTFSLNQLLLRFVSPATFGANAQLELLVNTILFYSREACRLSAQRLSLQHVKNDVYRFEGGVSFGTTSGTVQEVFNIGYIAFLLGIPTALIIAFSYYYFVVSIPYIGLSIALVTAASLIELASEPSYNLAQLEMDFKSRAAFESLAVTGKCVVTFVCTFTLSYYYSDAGTTLVAFAIGQLAYSILICALYFHRTWKQSSNFQTSIVWPQPIWRERTKMYISEDTTRLATWMWLQSLFKHVLTEGDKFLVSLLLSIEDQGVYAVVSNYGSLAARLLFLPVEESLRNFFSKVLATRPLTKSDLQTSISVLSSVLRAYIYVSMIAATWGPLLVPFFLSLVTSSTWYQAVSDTLSVYTCYIPFLAFNGALESFVQSAATSGDIKQQSRAMLFFFISFSVAGYLFMSVFHLNSNGLIYANIVNMVLRIAWCTRWIENFYRSQQTYEGHFQWLTGAIPSPTQLSISALAIAWAVYAGAVDSFASLLKQVPAVMLLLAGILYEERNILIQHVPYLSKVFKKEKQEKQENESNTHTPASPLVPLNSTVNEE